MYVSLTELGKVPVIHMDKERKTSEIQVSTIQSTVHARNRFPSPLCLHRFLLSNHNLQVFQSSNLLPELSSRNPLSDFIETPNPSILPLSPSLAPLLHFFLFLFRLKSMVHHYNSLITTIILPSPRSIHWHNTPIILINPISHLLQYLHASVDCYSMCIQMVIKQMRDSHKWTQDLH